MIDLIEKRDVIIASATKFFHDIMSLPESVRGKDDKPRPGIQVLVRVPGTRNLVFISVGQPSEAAMVFATEKAVRSNIFGDMASMNSADEKQLRYPGSITVDAGEINGSPMEEGLLQVSISGLRSEEDVAGAAIVAADLIDTRPWQVVNNVSLNGGIMPDVFYQKGHYLNEMLQITLE